MDKKLVLRVPKWVVIFFLFFLFLLSAFACEPFPLSDRSGLNSNTLTPFSAAMMETITARAMQNSGSGEELATANAKATAISQDKTAQAALDIAAFQATATANYPVLAELPTYGVNPLDGFVSWIHKPVTLDLNGYTQYGYANDYPEITAADFVLVSDITWNTQAASAGCGFLFRSNGNKDAPTQFMVYIAKYANGTAYFSATVDGNLANQQVFYPISQDKSFRWPNDSTNRLAVVAHGTLLDFYTNGVKIGEVDITKPPPRYVTAPIFPIRPANPTEEQLAEYNSAVNQYYKIRDDMQASLSTAQRNYNSGSVASMDDGFLAFMSVSEYGHTVCTFSNAWLFTIGRPPTPTPNLTWSPTPTLTPTLTVTYPWRPPTWTPTQTLVPSFTPTSTPLPTDTPTLSLPDQVGTATAACATFTAGNPGTPCP
jgi:hypothetical protein